jgi:hypothetical protein
MNREWIELTDIQSVAMAQANGWRIEVLSGKDNWSPWSGTFWVAGTHYRGRPKQPVTSECWRHKQHGGWQRFPEGDITGEVEE